MNKKTAPQLRDKALVAEPKIATERNKRKNNKHKSRYLQNGGFLLYFTKGKFF